MRRVEYRLYHIRVLHGDHHVPDARQPRTPSHDGTHPRADSLAHDKGNFYRLTLIRQCLTLTLFSGQRRQNIFEKIGWIGMRIRQMESM